MIITRARIASPCLLLLAAALCGCNTTPTADPAQASTPPTVAPPTRETAPIAPTPDVSTPVKDALTGLIAQEGSSPFPKGTRLLSVEVKAGVATLDFSKEFNALANNGDTTESLAQKSLRSALAKFPEVQKMRVTVEGKSFDSQNTDWSTPFAVRDSGSGVAAEGQGGGQ
jgi:hypothetical protein